MADGCCSCWAGLIKKTRSLRNQNRLSVDPVGSMEEALALSRNDSGTWQPSPMPRQRATAWATPVPRSAPRPSAHGGSFELVTVSLDSDARTSRAGGRVGGPRGAKRSKFEVEQLVASPGSLPRPMLPEEREAAIRALRPTATFEMLSKVPREFLERATPEAQDLRRSLVKGATVVFVSAGYAGKRFIFERAAELGIKSVVVDHPDSWVKDLVADGLVAKFLPVDMGQSSEEVLRQAVAAIRNLGSDGLTGSADAVTTFVELSVPLVSRLCAQLGLPGASSDAVDKARDKHRTRASLKEAGLPTPRNALIRSEGDVQAAAAEVGFPAVLKPVSGAASLGVKKVCNQEELFACYREVAAELGTLIVSCGALVKASAADGGVDASKVVDLTVLLEQYLDGVEVDVDVVMSEGEWRYAAVSDNGPTMEPYFNETWGIVPSVLPKDQQTALKDLAVSCVKALGFASGVFHVECKYTSTGPQLIEVNARMGGGPVREVNRVCWGVDLVEEVLFCALGVPSRPCVPARPLMAIGYFYVNAHRSGRVASTHQVDALRGCPGVLRAEPMVAVGDEVVGFEDGLASWVALLMVTDPDAKAALENVLQLESRLQLDIM